MPEWVSAAGKYLARADAFLDSAIDNIRRKPRWRFTAELALLGVAIGLGFVIIRLIEDATGGHPVGAVVGVVTSVALGFLLATMPILLVSDRELNRMTQKAFVRGYIQQQMMEHNDRARAELRRTQAQSRLPLRKGPT